MFGVSIWRSEYHVTRTALEWALLCCSGYAFLALGSFQCKKLVSTIESMVSCFIHTLERRRSKKSCNGDYSDQVRTHNKRETGTDLPKIPNAQLTSPPQFSFHSDRVIRVRLGLGIRARVMVRIPNPVVLPLVSLV